MIRSGKAPLYIVRGICPECGNEHVIFAGVWDKVDGSHMEITMVWDDVKYRYFYVFSMTEIEPFGTPLWIVMCDGIDERNVLEYTRMLALHNQQLNDLSDLMGSWGV